MSPRPVPSVRLSRRHLLKAAAATAGPWLAGCVSPIVPLTRDAPQRLRLLAEGRLPHRMEFRGSIVGGLSGLDYDPARDLWIAISDDRSEIQPARFYTFRMAIGPGERLRPKLEDVATLRRQGGEPFPNRTEGGEVVDPEAIRFVPGTDRVLWSSEGDETVGEDPAVRESRLDGGFVRRFTTPAALRFSGPGQGARSNQAFEGLALTPDGRGLWAAMEAPIEQDGPEAKVGVEGGPCRFTLFDLARGEAVRQIAYQPDSIPFAPIVPGGFADNGVSEILMVDARRMLVLERAYSLGAGLSIRLYEIDVDEGSDTLALQRLAPGTFRVAKKRPVADFALTGLARLDNTEGMCWGPPLPDGRRTLVVVSDDNFNPAQITQFAAFEYLDSP